MPAESALATITSFTGIGEIRVINDSAATATSRSMGLANVANALGSARRTVLGGDVANSALDTLADVTGLSFPVSSGITYKFRFFILFTTVAATTGSRWTINGPATTLLRYRAEWSSAALGPRFTIDGRSTYDSPATANSSSSGGNNEAVIEGIVTPSAGGTVIARFASEISGSAVTAKAGSYVEWEAIA